MKKPEKNSNVGIVWYTKREWEKMKQISIDSERLENSFQEWEEIALETLADIKATGLIGTKVFIKAEEFLLWCNIHSLPVNASSRSRYVSEIMSRRNSN